MIDIDHESKRGSPFCPKMGECCTGGTTKKMKGARCVAWQGLPMFEKTTGLTKSVSACADYEWPPQLGYELSGLMQGVRASTDKVATEVNVGTMAFFMALPDGARERAKLNPAALLPKKP
jgi:hypothetical protein